MTHLSLKNRKLLEKILFIAEISVTAVILLMSFLIFYYTDFSDSLDNGIMLFEAIGNGHFSDYYRYAAENCASETVYSANYNILLYLVFMIWNLPTAILHVTKGIDYMDSVKALLWCKTLILGMVIASSFVIRKILGLYVDDKDLKNKAHLFFLSSSCVVVPAMVASQYDIFSIFFILLGLYYYLKKDMKRFILFFVIAVPFKSFAFFVFVPLLLLREKNLLKIIGGSILVFIPQVLASLPFRGDEFYAICLDSQNRDAMQLLLDGSISVAGYSVNLFALSFAALCVFCYSRKLTFEEEKDPSVPIFITLCSIASFMLFINIRSYWVIMFIPFTLLLAFTAKKSLRINLLLFTVGSSCYTFHAIYNHWIYSSGKIVSELIFKRMDSIDIPEAEELKYASLREFFRLHDLSRFSQALYTVFFISIILLLVFNCPFFKKEEKKDRSFDLWILPMQLFLTTIPLCLILYVNFATAGYPVYSRGMDSDEYLDYNVTYNEGTITQCFDADENDTIEYIEFICENNNTDRMIRDTLRITISDNETGTVLVDETVGAAVLKDESKNRITFDPVDIIEGHTYCITVQGEHLDTPQISSIHMGITSSLEDEDYPMEVNGEPQDCNLAFVVK